MGCPFDNVVAVAALGLAGAKHELQKVEALIEAGDDEQWDARQYWLDKVERYQKHYDDATSIYREAEV